MVVLNLRKVLKVIRANIRISKEEPLRPMLRKRNQMTRRKILRREAAPVKSHNANNSTVSASYRKSSALQKPATVLAAITWKNTLNS